MIRVCGVGIAHFDGRASVSVRGTPHHTIAASSSRTTMKKFVGLFGILVLALLCSAMLFAEPAACTKPKGKRAVAAYHVPTSDSSSSSGAGSSDTSYDYTVGTTYTEASPITAGSDGWDTATSTSFDPNVHRPVGNSTANEAFAYTSSPAPARTSVSWPLVAGALVGVWTFGAVMF